MTDAPSYLKLCRERPFISYPKQDEIFVDAIQAFYSDDSRIWEKSREQGATWIIIFALVWCFLFIPGFSALCISRKETEVDEIGNYSRFMPKIDFVIEFLPTWMKPSYERKHLMRRNLTNGNYIDGESTNKGAGASRRYITVVVDEAAKIEELESVKEAITAVATSKFYISAHDSIVSYFVTMCRDSMIRKIRLHWTENPWCMEGAYERAGDGTIRIIDESFNFPANYNFHLPLGKSKLRSVWYDRMCKDLGDEKSIAQEVDIDLEGLDSHFFHFSTLDKLTKECVFDAHHTGVMDLTEHTFTAHVTGQLRLWRPLDDYGRLPLDRDYILGVDTALGSGKSGANSVISIGDCFLREKIGEFTSNEISPDELAKVAYSIWIWLGQPQVIPETHGVGTAFMRALQKLGCSRIWFRRDEKKLVPTMMYAEPGWSPAGDNKYILLAEYRSALTKGDYVTHSAEEILECRQYIDAGPKKVDFSPQLRSKNPVLAGANHGDRVISSALVWRAMMDTTKQLLEPEEKAVPQNTPMYHYLKQKREREAEESQQEEVVTW